MKNGELLEFKAKFLAVGTSEIELWCGGKPFVIPLNTKKQFDDNGFHYEDYSDMEVGEVRDSGDYEGIYVIRMK